MVEMDLGIFLLNYMISGNMCKALAAGADCVMLGRLVGGCEESPSKGIKPKLLIVKLFTEMEN